MPTSVAYIGTGQIMGWGNKAIEIRSVETGHLDGVFMHKKAQRLKFLCERNDKVVILHLYAITYKNIISHCLWILYCYKHNQYCIYSCFVAEQPNWGLDCLIVEESRSCRVRHSGLIGIPWTSDQLVATYITDTKDKHPCCQWDLNLLSQQLSDCRPTL